jgi:membrane protein DedA with SNARE-associated domain
MIGLVLSLTGTLWFFRATVLVGYAAGYGIAQADHNHKVFMLTTLAFLVAFIAFAISFGVKAIRQRKSKGRVA